MLNLAGKRAQFQRNRCSISPVLPLNSSGVRRLEEYSRRWSEKGAFDGDMIYLKQKLVCSYVTEYLQSRDVDSSMNGFRMFTDQLFTDPFYHDAFEKTCENGL